MPFDRFGRGAATWASIDEHFARRTLEDGLPSVEVPALFVHGTDDPIPMRASVDTAALMANATVVRLEGCGHFPWLEQRGELARVVGGFVAGSRPGRFAV